MAQLNLKVSENLYRETINQLGEKVQQLNGQLQALRSKREQIERYYSGPTATKAINTIKKDEENVERAITAVQTQKAQIEKYLNEMSTGDQEISGTYSDAMGKANTVFD